MKNYSIPWNMMPYSLRASLNFHGVSMRQTGLKFPKTVPKPALALLLSSLLDFKEDIVGGEENYINFAIGDTQNQFKTQYPETDLVKLLEDISQSKILRNLCVGKYGSAAILIQSLEWRIKACCSLLNIRGVKFKIDDFLSRDPYRVRATLGGLKRALLEINLFNDEFSDRFSSFVEDRNRFVHYMWTDVEAELSDYGMPCVSYFKKQLSFIFHVSSEAAYFDEVFIGFWTAIRSGVSGQNPGLGLYLDDGAVPTFIAALLLRPEHAEVVTDQRVGRAE